VTIEARAAKSSSQEIISHADDKLNNIFKRINPSVDGVLFYVRVLTGMNLFETSDPAEINNT
jgi:hypothetical protein